MASQGHFSRGATSEQASNGIAVRELREVAIRNIYPIFISFVQGGYLGYLPRVLCVYLGSWD